MSYTYDTWGKLISTTGSLAGTLGVKNPYRYRGYRYDTETGLYYLQSRYYNPDWGRFVNADDSGILEVDQDSLIENNLFVYALNNPVNMSDDSGYIAWWIGAAVGGAAIDSAIYLAGALINRRFSWSGLGKAALRGAIVGVAFGAAGKLASKAIKIISSKSNILWTTWGSYAKKKIGTRVYAKIGKRLYTEHAVERMMPKGLTNLGRSISPNFVEEVLKNGKLISTRVVNGAQREVWRLGTIEVVTEKAKSIIITVITK